MISFCVGKSESLSELLNDVRNLVLYRGYFVVHSRRQIVKAGYTLAVRTAIVRTDITTSYCPDGRPNLL